MNRRNFLTTLAQAAAAFTILPAATTYERKWKYHGGLWIDTEYQCIMLPPSAESQRAFVTAFFWGIEIPNDIPVWTYDDFTKRRMIEKLEAEANRNI